MSKNTDLPLLSGEKKKKKHPGPKVFCWQSCYYPAACGPGSIPHCIFFLDGESLPELGKFTPIRNSKTPFCLHSQGCYCLICWLRSNFQLHCSSVPRMKKTNHPINRTILSTSGKNIYILPISSSYCPQHICKTVCPE